MSLAHIGKIPWNKGINWRKTKIRSIEITCLNCSKKRLVRPNQIKKGNGKFCTTQCANEYNVRKGKDHHNWKEKGFSYIALHTWIKRELGKATKCERCGSTKNIQWANKSHAYKRELDDWVQLCIPCHRRFDKNYKFAKKKRFG